ncbi:hypothetical protein L210DRAFT_3555639, partial [Boletus edulis BED1]
TWYQPCHSSRSLLFCMYFVLARGQTPFFDDLILSLSSRSVGGLDPYLSRHALTLLKLVCKHLRLLVDQECISIGHGSKDIWVVDRFSTCL